MYQNHYGIRPPKGQVYQTSSIQYAQSKHKQSRSIISILDNQPNKVISMPESGHNMIYNQHTAPGYHILV